MHEVEVMQGKAATKRYRAVGRADMPELIADSRERVIIDRCSVLGRPRPADELG